MVKNIVIVGGGFAGTQVANALEKALVKANDKDHRIILIEKKTHFYHSIGGLRSAVLDWDNKIMIPYTNLFQIKTNKVVQASTVKLEKDQIELDRSVPEFGNTISYDYLIIATGTHYPAPAKATTLDYESSRANLKSLRVQVKSAKSIVIVGGGPVGIELAGEIRDVYTDAKIAIVHNKDGFLDEASLPTPKLRQKLNDLAKKNKIDTLFNDSVILPADLNESFYAPEGKVVETKCGKSFTDVDLVLLAFGNRPQTEWLKNSALGTEIVSANGYVKVKKTLQIDHVELNHVFVLGDAADLKETKMAFRIGAHVPVVVENVIQFAVKKSKPTAEYKKGPDAMFVTFGKKQGAGVLPLFGGVTVGNWIVSTLKSASLFTSQSFKTLNAKEPATAKTQTVTPTATLILIIALVAGYIYGTYC